MFDLKAARDAGANDAQIVDFLSQQHGDFDLKAAREANVDDAQIAEFLAQRPMPAVSNDAIRQDPAQKQAMKDMYAPGVPVVTGGEVVPVDKTTAMDRAGDLATSVVAGVARSGSGIVGLADLALTPVRKGVEMATGMESGTAGTLTGALAAMGVDFNEAQNVADQLKSPASKKSKAAVDAGFDEGLSEGATQLLNNPSYVAEAVAGTLPDLISMGVAVKGLAVKVYQKAATEALKRGATKEAADIAAREAVKKAAPELAKASAIIEGGISAGQSASSKAGDGLTDREAGFSVAQGVGTAAGGYAANKLNKAIGLEDIEAAKAGREIAGAFGSMADRVRAFMKGGASEAIEEAAQGPLETMIGNLESGKPLTEGVGRSAVEGAVVGFGAGAPMSAVGPSSRNQQEPSPESAVDPVPEVDPDTTATQKIAPQADLAAIKEKVLANQELSPEEASVFESNPDAVINAEIQLTPEERAEADAIIAESEAKAKKAAAAAEIKKANDDLSSARAGIDAAMAEGGRDSPAVKVAAERVAIAKRKLASVQAAHAEPKKQEAAQDDVKVTIKPEDRQFINKQADIAKRDKSAAEVKKWKGEYSKALKEFKSVVELPETDPARIKAENKLIFNQKKMENAQSSHAKFQPKSVPAVTEKGVEVFDSRLTEKDALGILDGIAEQWGWEGQGGKMITAPPRDHQGGSPEVIGRTSWVPKHPAMLPGYSQEYVKNAIQKALSGQKLQVKQEALVKGLLDYIEENHPSAVANVVPPIDDRLDAMSTQDIADDMRFERTMDLPKNTVDKAKKGEETGASSKEKFEEKGDAPTRSTRSIPEGSDVQGGATGSARDEQSGVPAASSEQVSESGDTKKMPRKRVPPAGSEARKRYDEARKEDDDFNPKFSKVNKDEKNARLISNIQRWADSRQIDGRGIIENTSGKPSQSSTYSDFDLGEGSFLSEESSPETVKKESDALIKSAKENGFFWDNNSPIFDAIAEGDRPFDAGAEHDVYFVGERGHKIAIRATANGAYGPTKDTSPAQYLHRLEEGNIVFPELEIRMIGVSQDEDGNAVIWTAQNYVDGGQEFHSEEILEEAMADAGWKNIGRYRYENKETGAIIQDAHTGNVLYDDDGNLYFIDVQVEKLPDRTKLSKKSPLGLFSQLTKSAYELKQDKGTPEQMLSMLQKAGVKQAEIDATGLFDYIKTLGKSVTKQQIIDFAEAGGVQIEEAVLRDNEDAKFASYQLPGGENYKEILLTLPVNNENRYTKENVIPLKGADAEKYGDPENLWFFRVPGNVLQISKKKYKTEDEAIDYILRDKQPEPSAKTNFTSGHYDQKNILAHARINERVDTDGKKVLFIEEIQSDWAQEGRKKGFAGGKTVEDAKKFFGISDEAWSKISNEERLAYLDEMNSGEPHVRGAVPSAPFVTNTDAWVSLAMKRMITYAAENGFDRVAWTTGEQQADRYSLAKQVDKVSVELRDGGTRYIRLDMPSGDMNSMLVDDNGVVIKHAAWEGKPLEEIIGKEITKKVMEAPANQEFSGLDLQVGGEGMKAFYDSIIPKVASKIIGKMGGKVGAVRINIPDSSEKGNAVGDENNVITARAVADWREVDAGYFTSDKHPDKSVAEYPSAYKIDYGKIPSKFYVIDERPEHRRDGTAKTVELYDGTTFYGVLSEHKTLEDAIRTMSKVDKEGQQPGFDITDKMREQVASEGLPLFKRGEKNANLNPEKLRAEIKKRLPRYAPHIQVVQNFGQLPNLLQNKLRNQGYSDGANGLYDPGTREAYVFSDYVDSVEHALETVLHEVAGHKALHLYLGEDGKRFYRGVFNSPELAEQRFNVEKKYRKEKEKYVKKGKLKEYQEWMGEEMIAEIAEKGNKPSFMEWATAKLKRLIRKFYGLDYSIADVNELIQSSQGKLDQNAKEAKKKADNDLKLSKGGDGLPKLPDRIEIFRYLNSFDGLSPQELASIGASAIEFSDELFSPHDQNGRPPVVTQKIINQIDLPVLVYSGAPDKTAVIWNSDMEPYRVIGGMLTKISDKEDQFSDMTDAQAMTVNILSRAFQNIKRKDPAVQKKEAEDKVRRKETGRKQRRLQNIPKMPADFDEALQELADWAEDFEEFSAALSPNMFDLSDRNLTRIGRATMALEPDEYENAGSGEVTIYRAMPMGEEIEAGDWVSFNEEYASGHESNVDKGNAYTHSMEVDGADVWWPGADESEWVYIPSNTWGNVKSLEDLWHGLTGGKKDNQVRLSKKKPQTENSGAFDPDNADIRFSKGSMGDTTGAIERYIPEMPEKDSVKLKRRIASGYKRWFTKEAGLPPSFFQAKLEGEGMRSELIDIESRYRAAIFRKAIEAAYGVPYGKLEKSHRDELNKALMGEPAKIPEKAKMAIQGMRDSLDAMSEALIKTAKDMVAITLQDATPKERLAYINWLKDGANPDDASGVPAEAIKQTLRAKKIQANKGTYLNRSYQAFDDPKWMDKVLQDKRIIAKAAKYLEENGDPNPMTTIKTMLSEAQDKASPIDFIATEGKKLGIFKQRKDISPEIRDLLGEHKEPLLNYERSLSKMANIIGAHRVLNGMRESGLESGLLSKAPTAEKYVEIKGGESFTPLSGLYASPEVAQAIKDYTTNDVLTGWLRAIGWFNSLVKTGKTVYSIKTQARNFFSNIALAISNGHIDPLHLAEAAKTAVIETYKPQNMNRAFIGELARRGVIHNATINQELQAQIKDALGGKEPHGIQKVLKVIADISQATYGLSDNVWKINGYLHELDRAKAKGMNEADAKREAANRTIDVYPSYNMIPQSMDKLRRLPIGPSFVAWPWEILRTTKNQAKYIAQDWSSGNKADAAKRAVGNIAASGFFYAVAKSTLEAMGLDDEDDEALKMAQPPFRQNSTFAYFRGDNGELRATDLSAYDPRANINKVINAAMKKDGGAWEAVKEALAPFFGVQIGTNAVIEAYTGFDGLGNKVWDKDVDTDAEIAQKAILHIVKSSEPGVAGTIEALYRAKAEEINPLLDKLGWTWAMTESTSRSGRKYTTEDAALQLVGFTSFTIEPSSATESLSYRYSEASAEASKNLTRVVTRGGVLPPSIIKEAVSDYKEDVSEAREPLKKFSSVVIKSGLLTPAEFMEAASPIIGKESAGQILYGVPVQLKNSKVNSMAETTYQRLTGDGMEPSKAGAEVSKRVNVLTQEFYK